jgi:hypothetical protein
MATLDLPANVVSAPGGGWYADSLAVEGDASGFTGHTQMTAANFAAPSYQYVYVTFDLSPASGLAVTQADYVVRAYREASYTAPDDTTSAQFAIVFGISRPHDLPALVASHGSHVAVVPALQVNPGWGAVTERIVNEPDLTGLLSGGYHNTWTAVQSDTLVALVQWDYLALRLTYTTGLDPGSGEGSVGAWNVYGKMST